MNKKTKNILLVISEEEQRMLNELIDNFSVNEFVRANQTSVIRTCIKYTYNKFKSKKVKIGE